VGVLQYADGLHFVWLKGSGTGFGSVVIWLPGCLVGLVSALQWRDKKGHPVKPSKSPLAVTKSFLSPSEVNARPIMATWQLDWDPKLELGLTAQEEYEQFGWKGALKLEEKRLQATLKAKGISLHKTERAELLRDYALKHGIVNKSGEVPSVGSIRNAVFY